MSRQPLSSTRRSFAARAFGASWRLALIVFHAILLAGRVSDASILEPAVLARWCGSLALILTVVLFQRFAPVRLRGRRAVVVFWVLAALLHLFGPVQQLGHELDLELTLGLALPVLILALLLAAGWGAASPTGRVHVRRSLSRQLAPGVLLLAPRGPPFVLS